MDTNQLKDTVLRYISLGQYDQSIFMEIVRGFERLNLLPPNSDISLQLIMEKLLNAIKTIGLPNWITCSDNVLVKRSIIDNYIRNNYAIYFNDTTNQHRMRLDLGRRSSGSLQFRLKCTSKFESFSNYFPGHVTETMCLTDGEYLNWATMLVDVITEGHYLVVSSNPELTPYDLE